MNSRRLVEETYQPVFDAVVETYLATTSNRTRALRFIEDRMRPVYVSHVERMTKIVADYLQESDDPLSEQAPPVVALVFPENSDEALLQIMQLEPNTRKADAAFTKLYERYAPAIEKYALRSLPGCDEDTAQDVVQNTLLRLKTEVKSLDLSNPTPLIAWLKRVAKNGYISAGRKSRAQQRVSIDDEQSGSEHIPALTQGSGEASVIQADLLQRLNEIASGLSDLYKVPLAMFYGEGASIKTIADALGISDGTVKSRLDAARKMLKNSEKVERIMRDHGYRKNNPSADADEVFDRFMREYLSPRTRNPGETPAMSLDAKYDLVMGEVRKQYPMPIDQGFATGYLRHLIYDKPAPVASSIPKHKQQEIITFLQNKVLHGR
jgi:RNA polymerase sigma-70 factor (ECF subfamily)